MNEEVKAVSGILIPEGMRASQSPIQKTGSKKENNDFSFSVAVGDVYEGPLDLLLDLIRKQDIDIYDIPIARITAQYLTYVERMRGLDVNVAADFIYEPEPRDVLDALLPRYVESQVYQAVLENTASFYAAQMVAMRNATDNADDLIGDLTLTANKVRQATITTELMEIVGGATALQG